MARAVLLPVLLLGVACQGHGSFKIGSVPSADLQGTVSLRGFGNPVLDATICVLDSDVCTATATDGSFTLALPLDAETGVTVQHEDIVSVVVPVITSERGDPPEVDLALWSVGEWDQMAFVGNVDWVPGTGALQVEARQAANPPQPGQPDPGTEGVEVRVDLDGGRARYLDDQGRYVDGSLGGTSGSGTVLFFDLPAGAERTMTLIPASGHCSLREFGWAHDVVPVLADHVTLAVQACVPAR